MQEWIAIFTSILAICLSLTFYSAGLSLSPLHFIFMMLVFAVTVGPGFVLHELAHKYVANRFGARARFEAWVWGLILMLAMAIIPQVLWNKTFGLFLAPGAVMIFARRIDAYQNGLISAAGPIANLVLAFAFLIASLAVVGGLDFENLPSINYTLAMICTMGVKVNFGLALFNLLPIFPLDGLKVLLWNWKVWLALFLISFFGSNILGF
jgi:Zn-dependent protease